MELLFYIFIKPYVLILESAFTVFGRIMFVQTDLIFSFLTGLLFFIPIYIELKMFQRKWLSKITVKQYDKKISKTSKEYYFIVIGHILPLLSQVLIAYSVLTFVKSIHYLEGVQYMILPDLSKPDGIIGNVINLLPILYFIINTIIVVVNKKNTLYIKLISIAENLILTVLLYNMPSSALLFWMLFSISMTVIEMLIMLYRVLRLKGIIKESSKSNKKILTEKEDYLLYYSGLAYVVLFAGYYIPTNIIKISSQEFVDVSEVQNPMHFIVYSMALAIGMFGIPGSVCYLFAKTKLKMILERIIWAIVGIASVDYIFSGAYQGELSSGLAYFDPKEFETKHIIASLALATVIMVLFIVLMEKKKEFMKIIALIQLGILVVSLMINTIKVTNEYYHMDYLNGEEDSANITLGKNGKNVVVLIMDRALGPVVPFLFEEKPELKEEFDGFIYYPNTVSFGAYTNT